MHLASLNITDLFLSLWRGSLECDKADDKTLWDWAVLQGDVWQTHGDVVTQATPYLPGSFDRPPRNPCEKISSGYKAWEFLLYFYALGPAIFRGVLPDKYWRHYCKLVAGIRILHQRSITRAQLVSAHTYLTEFIQEFEELYYQRLVSRLHFCRQSIHLLWHLGQEVVRVGPPAYYTQWTMERTIGNLGEEIKQPSKPYANLSERAVRRAQTGALKAAVPSFASVTSRWPRGSLELDQGYALLRARDRSQYMLAAREADALLKYYQDHNEPILTSTWSPNTHRWARVALPTGQIARSAWKENLKPLEKLRTSRNVKARVGGRLEFGEVRYFFVTRFGAQPRALAMISQYAAPDGALLASSLGTVYSCEYRGDEALVVIDVQDILLVVAVIPEPATAQVHSGRPYSQSRFFVAEKLGLEVADLSGIVENLQDGDTQDNDDQDGELDALNE
ncbi:hypothetical protein CERSUDRAFT_48348 [Gelatoporia subvermispora B]|uniref:Uncharacterized protein n=1 Tax=Ceriporiopsis subvermispora (strain B) TaxID=914234 RepID=M2RIR0_CERS8|nr:hypothetical protein CERSUDRAFT_48348 [Gelatoporia subvermispora B]